MHIACCVAAASHVDGRRVVMNRLPVQPVCVPRGGLASVLAAGGPAAGPAGPTCVSLVPSLPRCGEGAAAWIEVEVWSSPLASTL